jgi:hypothetical protein
VYLKRSLLARSPSLVKFGMTHVKARAAGGGEESGA